MAVAKPGDAGANRYNRAGGGQSRADQASWEDADAEELWRTVCAITEAGDAVTLGKTSDGGAVAITILCGKDRPKFYAHSAEELSARLRAIRVSLEATD